MKSVQKHEICVQDKILKNTTGIIFGSNFERKLFFGGQNRTLGSQNPTKTLKIRFLKAKTPLGQNLGPET